MKPQKHCQTLRTYPNNRTTAAITLQCLAFWPVWRWYFARMTDGSDEPWGLLALVTALLFFLLKRKEGPLPSLAFMSAAGFTLLYAFSYHLVPPLARAVLAILAVSSLVGPACAGSSLCLGVSGLLLLSLPLIASLQFYAGYPVRLCTAFLAAELISATGFITESSGTSLVWLGEVIAVDAPCAGIRMLWCGLYLNFTLACIYELSPLRTWASYSFSLCAIFAANVLRATALFYLEAGIVKLPVHAHTGIGLVAFTMVAITIISWHQYLQRSPCVLRSCS